MYKKSRRIEIFLGEAPSRRSFAACESFLCGLKNVKEKYRRDSRVVLGGEKKRCFVEGRVQ